MNEQNYASLKASQRLVDVGIVLETDCVWCPETMIPEASDKWMLITKARFDKDFYDFDPHIPAPSMAEVWRELPEGTGISKALDTNFAEFVNSDGYRKGEAENTNPTDALIDLLIWVRKEMK